MSEHETNGSDAELLAAMSRLQTHAAAVTAGLDGIAHRLEAAAFRLEATAERYRATDQRIRRQIALALLHVDG